MLPSSLLKYMLLPLKSSATPETSIGEWSPQPT